MTGRAAGQASAALEAFLAEGGECAGLEARVRVCEEALQSLNDDHGWAFMSDANGCRMHQRTEADGAMSVKIESLLEGVRPSDTLKIW
eukprot:5280702-Prymnesium_polylepis.1